ncbi:MAG: hypothetical protein ACSW8J_02910, partial [bacterium]
MPYIERNNDILMDEFLSDEEDDQEQQEQQQKQQQKEKTTRNTTTTTRNSTGNSSTTTTVYTHPGVFMKWDDEAVNEIAKKYQQMIGMEINCAVGAFLKKCMYAGMDWLVVLDAIEKTG